MVPKGRLMTEAEWRGLGVQQSRGWIHYMMHDPGNTYTHIYIHTYIYIVNSRYIEAGYNEIPAYSEM